MFGKKCFKCRNKISENFDFCPHCGKDLKKIGDSEDYGLIGKNDYMDESNFTRDISLPFSKIFTHAMKELPAMIKLFEKQMRGLNEDSEKEIKRLDNNLNIQFFVNGKPMTTKKRPDNKTMIKTAPLIGFDKIKKLHKLPKKEPISKIRRLSGKLIYDISVPGVKNIEDVLINQLENSIEIKAISKDKVYSKILNINLPILGYSLDKGHLILELKAK